MKKFFKDKRITVAVLVVVLVLLLMDFNQRMVLLTSMRGLEKEMEQRYAHLEATLAALEAELAFAALDEAVEKWAREEASMIQEGDTPIILLTPANATPIEITPQPPLIEEINKWQIWQELFFGD